MSAASNTNIIKNRMENVLKIAKKLQFSFSNFNLHN